MHFGFYLPTRGRTATPEALETLVVRGEALPTAVGGAPAISGPLAAIREAWGTGVGKLVGLGAGSLAAIGMGIGAARLYRQWRQRNRQGGRLIR